MGREVRRVPPDWEHPKFNNGAYIPLHKGSLYVLAMQEWERNCPSDPPPNPQDFMPVWGSEATHYQMYETCSEGTPISPVCASPEELAQWLDDNNASAFGRLTATYEQWLRVARGGYACSAVLIGGQLESGVAGLHENNDDK